MLQLQPQEIFAIAYQLSDPSDTGTYYVQAKIRDAMTDKLLDTINLTDKGDQRFRSTAVAPADGNNSGSYITVTVKVYTDSGYTTLSPNYQIEETQYLVRAFPQYFGGGGSGMTPNMVRDALKPLFEAIPRQIDFTKPLNEIRGTLDDLKERKELDILPIDKSLINLAQLFEIMRVKQGIMHEMIKNLPQPKPIDFTVIYDRLDILREELADTNKSVNQKAVDDIQGIAKILNNTLDKIKTFFADDMDFVKEQLDKISKFTSAFTVAINTNEKED